MNVTCVRLRTWRSIYLLLFICAGILGCLWLCAPLHELDAVGPRGWVLVRLEVVQGQPKLAQNAVAEPLQRVCV